MLVSETGLTTGPSTQAVGQLFYELAEAFAVGALAAELPPLRARGEELQLEAAALTEEVSRRLGIVLEDPASETGLWAAVARVAGSAWRWLRGTSTAILGAASKHGGKVVQLALVGGAVLTVYDFLTGEEQTRRAAISAKKAAALALIEKMPPSQVEAAFSRVTAGLDSDSSEGFSWWWLLLIGGGAYVGYRLLERKR